jgi:hypothetical protein
MLSKTTLNWKIWMGTLLLIRGVEIRTFMFSHFQFQAVHSPGDWSKLVISAIESIITTF